jgi:hypothetical protein
LRRANACSHARLASDPPEETRPGLLENLELGVVLIDAQLVEGAVLGFLGAAPRGFDPLHLQS